MGLVKKICGDVLMEQTISEIMKQKDQYTIFIEPKLDTGFPDIVIVCFFLYVFDASKEERSKCSIGGIQVRLRFCTWNTQNTSYTEGIHELE